MHHEKIHIPLQVFCEVIGVKHTLKQQIVMAIKPQYLEALHDPTTGRIMAPLYYNAIRHLFQFYGKVTPELLFEQE